MSCSVENKEIGEGGGEIKSNGSAKSMIVVGLENSVSQNGSVSDSQFNIDDKLLIDPRLLAVRTEIGEGAHGTVYEGQYGDQVVAIKVLNCGNNPEERAVLEGRFACEINMMCKVKHANLVKFIGACKDPYMVIVSELLPGMSLRKCLLNIRPEPLELRVSIGYALDIARAMECLHANGIIHRDLKPGTVQQFIGACKDPYMVIVSELLPGMSLRKCLLNIRPEPLELRVSIGYALDIARAMECLHANGIIHRDLKPGTVQQFIGACKDPYMVIVSELLPGMSLRKCLLNIRPEPLELRVSIGYALDIARAMECLHANGIIHRDLKPGTVQQFIGACKDPYMVIVSELLPGMSLRKCLLNIRPEPLELRVSIGYALDIARAMECLHANGIIHRDLKPDNLLLTANHNSVKLADFGLAREESVTEMMTAGTGTYRWMAPEESECGLAVIQYCHIAAGREEALQQQN